MQRLDRQRLAEQKALHLVAVLVAQQAHLRRALHALGGHRDAQRLAERDDRLDDGAVVAGDLSAAQAREHVAVAEYERAIETAFREVADALAGRRFLAERLEAQQRNRDTLRRLAEIARDRYAEGVVNYLEVLDAERNLFEAEQAWIAAQRAQAQNLVTLSLALGGGLEPPGADAP